MGYFIVVFIVVFIVAAKRQTMVRSVYKYREGYFYTGANVLQCPTEALSIRLYSQ